MSALSSLIVGNLISLFAALFLAASCIAKHPKRIFMFQFAESVLLAVSQIVFGRPIGALTLLISAVRNLLVAYRRYTKGLMFAFLLIAIVFPFLTEQLGSTLADRLLDLLPMVSTVQFTLFSYFASSEKHIKFSILLTLFLWSVYAFLILDLATAVSNTVIFLVDLTVLIRLIREEQRGKNGISNGIVS